MSSLRNAIPRPAHKERSQPQARKRFGLLEKHNDYVIRANAYHKMQETLKILRQKAAFKNPDEFNFKMINSKTVDGYHRPNLLQRIFHKMDCKEYGVSDPSGCDIDANSLASNLAMEDINEDFYEKLSSCGHNIDSVSSLETPQVASVVNLRL